MRHPPKLVLSIGLIASLIVSGCNTNRDDSPRASAGADESAQLATVKVPSTQPAVQANRTSANIETVALIDGPMPTGVTVSHDGRIFICIPRWGDPVEFTVAEVTDGKAHAYPDRQINQLNTEKPSETLVSVQSVVVDPANRLWLLDTGNMNMGPNMPRGPKMVCVNLQNNQVERMIHFDENVAKKTTYLNDVRFDLSRGQEGIAYITDSGVGGIIVVDLASGQAWRKLDGHPSVKPDLNYVPVVEGEPLMVREPGTPAKPLQIASDGIALSNDGKTLYYRPLISTHLYSVSTDALVDRNAVNIDVRDHGDLGFASDGLEFDAQGRLYLTDYNNHAVRFGDPNSSPRGWTVVSDPRMIWPDTLSVGNDGYVYIMVNQLNRQPRFHNGQDLRDPPYALMRVDVDAKPVMLRKQ